MSRNDIVLTGRVFKRCDLVPASDITMAVYVGNQWNGDPDEKKRIKPTGRTTGEGRYTIRLPEGYQAALVTVMPDPAHGRTYMTGRLVVELPKGGPGHRLGLEPIWIAKRSQHPGLIWEAKPLDCDTLVSRLAGAFATVVSKADPPGMSLRILYQLVDVFLMSEGQRELRGTVTQRSEELTELTRRVTAALLSYNSFDFIPNLGSWLTPNVTAQPG